VIGAGVVANGFVEEEAKNKPNKK